MALDRVLEAAGNFHRLAAAGEVGNQEAELIAPEARMQVPPVAAFDGEKVLRSNLIGKNPRHALDDLVADGMTEIVNGLVVRTA